MRRSRIGVTVAAIREKTGFGEIQIGNTIYRQGNRERSRTRKGAFIYLYSTHQDRPQSPLIIVVNNALLAPKKVDIWPK